MSITHKLTRPTIAKPITRLASQATNTSFSARILPVVPSKSFSQHHRLSSAPRKEWMAYVPDLPDSLDKRLSVRQKHFDNIQPSIKDQSAVFGGCTFTEHPTKQGEAGDMNGSFMLLQAETEEEAREWLQNDPYTKAGVWNMDAVQIWPFRSAFRTPTK